ncbi:hydantoinase/oxoprolinase family protein [Methylosoma difficile]
MTIHSLGWDIGGAHLKAAVLDADGKLLASYQQACPLWQGLEKLQQAVAAILAQLPERPYRHAMTMTGELVDLFDNRNEGVAQILHTMQALLPDAEWWVYAGKDGLLPIGQVGQPHYAAIASANWLATASVAAQRCTNGLLVDIGSTTTDVLLFKNSQVLAEGYSDYQRLVSRELVYTGIVRTPVMAVAQSVQDDDQDVPLMAEYFATMADVYRLTGELNEAHDQAATADGGEKTIQASAKRLARMLGCDFYPEELGRWQDIAQNLRLQQLQMIETACVQQLSRTSLPKGSALIGAGVGRFLLKKLAMHLRYPYQDFADLFENGEGTEASLNAADCAPAVAVASLLLGSLQSNSGQSDSV